jgi:hypothetical protein
LAKGRLVSYCQEQDLTHWSFNDFKDATGLLAAWLGSHTPRTRHEQPENREQGVSNEAIEG